MQLIDAEALYDEVREKRDVYAKRLENGSECGSDLFYCGAFQIVLSMIRDQKMIYPELCRFGEWIEDDYLLGYYHCSECGFEFAKPEEMSPYCQKCGAMMTNYEK